MLAITMIIVTCNVLNVGTKRISIYTVSGTHIQMGAHWHQNLVCCVSGQEWHKNIL